MNRILPYWFKQGLPDQVSFAVAALLREFGVQTVCHEAHCPNSNACFKNRTATFLILGNRCTRKCLFCAVEKSGLCALTVVEDEPFRIQEVTKRLGLRYLVITSVTRDDLGDGGAGHFAKTIELIRELAIGVEVLVPDFRGNISSIQRVVEARPNVFAHNLETVKRLTPEVRPGSDYRRSLSVLKQAKKFSPGIITKSSLMLGLGESKQEVIDAMQDLMEAKCDCLTLGQYLAPSQKHFPVKEFITPAQFKEYESTARRMGFTAVLSGPLVRSSYNAEMVYLACCKDKR